MSPDRKISLAEKRRKFRKLLEDIDAADSKVLRLFPCIDFQGGTFGLQAKKGLKTALRTLIVAAEDGYVNENELSKYGVGGDSRHRLLPRLLYRGLLTRSEKRSERGGKKFVYELSDKGVVLCAAFPRILKSYLYVSLINNRVANRPLAYTMLTLYDADSMRKSGRNHLLEVLRFAADSGLNVEHVSEKEIARRLLLEEEAMSRDAQETFLFRLCRELIDWASSASDDDIADVRKSVSDLLDLLRSKDPDARAMARRLFPEITAGLRDMLQFVRSSDFQVWRRLPHKTRFREILLETIQAEAGDLQLGGVDALRRAWDNRKLILGEIREKMREESFLSITKRLGEKP